MQFDYTTGSIKRDFKLVYWEETCKLSGLPCWVGNKRCQKCKYYGGTFLYHGFYVLCKHPEQKETKNWGAIGALMEKFKKEALSQL